MQFLNSNLLEVCKKSGKKLVQMYPRNCQNYLSSLKDNTEVYIYTPSFNTIMAMGGLDILWPLADVLFLFSNNKIDNIHKLILSCIRLFIESVNQYPEFKLHLSRNDYVDSKIEGYYRKYMKIEMKESDSSGFYRSIFVNEGFTPDYMFLQEFPIQLLIDILLSSHNANADKSSEGRSGNSSSLNRPFEDPGNLIFYHFMKMLVCPKKEKQRLSQNYIENPSMFHEGSYNYVQDSYTLEEAEESVEDFKSYKDAVFVPLEECTMKKCITQVGYLFDLYYHSQEPNPSLKMILLNMCKNEKSKLGRKIFPEKDMANMVSQYLLHLIDHYLMKSDTSEKKNNNTSSTIEKIEKIEKYCKVLELIQHDKNDYAFDYKKVCSCFDSKCVFWVNQMQTVMLENDD